MSQHQLTLEAALRLLPDYSPCESPIEDVFYQDYQKRAPIGLKIERQFECPTPLGSFVLDFFINRDGRRVGFECDGKDFHDRIRDGQRDRAIVEAGHADRIYRMRGRDIWFHLHDTMDLVRKQDPSLFSERGHDHIRVLASRDHEYRDELHRPLEGFPYAMVRWYEPLGVEGDEDEGADWRRSFPTVIQWTDRL